MNDRLKFRIYDLEQKHYLRVIQDETTGAEGFAAFYGKYNNICKPMSFFLLFYQFAFEDKVVELRIQDAVYKIQLGKLKIEKVR